MKTPGPVGLDSLQILASLVHYNAKLTISRGIAILAEKPSVARDIARVLGATSKGDGYLHGNGYVVA